METIIYLIRHGETNWNKQRKFQGQIDIALNEFGRNQAKKLANKFSNSNVSIDAVYSSNLKRAKETAEYIASKYNHNVIEEPGLRERSFGILEGKNIEEFRNEYPNVDLNDLDSFDYLKVEPFNEFKKRMYDTVFNITIQQLENSIVVVSHGAAINTFLHEITGGEQGTGITRISNTGITTIIYDHRRKKWLLKDVNDASHVEAI